MSAPVLRHDLRCGSWAGRSCTCRDTHSHTRHDGTTVAPLSRYAPSTCPVCEKPAEWMVGPDDRACTGCVGFVLAYAYARSDGFSPPLVLPVGGAR